MHSQHFLSHVPLEESLLVVIRFVQSLFHFSHSNLSLNFDQILVEIQLLILIIFTDGVFTVLVRCYDWTLLRLLSFILKLDSLEQLIASQLTQLEPILLLTLSIPLSPFLLDLHLLLILIRQTFQSQCAVLRWWW